MGKGSRREGRREGGCREGRGREGAGGREQGGGVVRVSSWALQLLQQQKKPRVGCDQQLGLKPGPRQPGLMMINLQCARSSCRAGGSSVPVVAATAGSSKRRTWCTRLAQLSGRVKSCGIFTTISSAGGGGEGQGTQKRTAEPRS